MTPKVLRSVSRSYHAVTWGEGNDYPAAVWITVDHRSTVEGKPIDCGHHSGAIFLGEALSAGADIYCHIAASRVATFIGFVTLTKRFWKNLVDRHQH